MGLVLRGPGFVKHLISLLITLLSDFLHLKQLISHSPELLRTPSFSNLESKAEKSLIPWMKEETKISA